MIILNHFTLVVGPACTKKTVNICKFLNKTNNHKIAFVWSGSIDHRSKYSAIKNTRVEAIDDDSLVDFHELLTDLGNYDGKFGKYIIVFDEVLQQLQFLKKDVIKSLFDKLLNNDNIYIIMTSFLFTDIPKPFRDLPLVLCTNEQTYKIIIWDKRRNPTQSVILIEHV
jgi:thymidine kinase